MKFSRPEYRSGYTFPSPRDLPSPGIEPKSPALQVESSNCNVNYGKCHNWGISTPLSACTQPNPEMEIANKIISHEQSIMPWNVFLKREKSHGWDSTRTDFNRVGSKLQGRYKNPECFSSSLKQELHCRQPGRSGVQRSLKGYSPRACQRVGHNSVTKQQRFRWKCRITRDWL